MLCWRELRDRAAESCRSIFLEKAVLERELRGIAAASYRNRGLEKTCAGERASGYSSRKLYK